MNAVESGEDSVQALHHAARLEAMLAGLALPRSAGRSLNEEND
jgi:hypothetical protein